MLGRRATVFIGIAGCNYIRESNTKKLSVCDTGGIDSAVGNTPMIYLRSLSDQTGCKIYAKAEFLNPTGSVKDRAAKAIIEEAEKWCVHESLKSQN